MRMLPDMDRRLLNWARYVALMCDGGRVGRAGLEHRVDGEGWDAPTVIPTGDAEAEETGRGVMTLRSELRAATECWYLGAGGVAAKARRLCCSESTLRERVGLAHRELSQWLADQVLMARRERERVEALRTPGRAG